MRKLWLKIRRKWTRLRLQPIRVFCLHHVCKHFDASWMHESDWMPLQAFQEKIVAMRESGVEFISLTKAYEIIRKQQSLFSIRRARYAVLTFDDGYASLREVLPWLQHEHIPYTLFVNPDYADGKSYRESPQEAYLSREELAASGVEIGMHGLQHLDVTKMTKEEFSEFLASSYGQSSIINPQSFIPFWAYTWGKHNDATDKILQENSFIPVYIDGVKNYDDTMCIHREILK